MPCGYEARGWVVFDSVLSIKKFVRYLIISRSNGAQPKDTQRQINDGVYIE
jgi:hypothetical protein